VSSARPVAPNHQVAARLEEVGRLLEAEGRNPFRAGAYGRAAETLRGLDRSVAEILETEGIDGLDRLPGVGQSIARAIRELIVFGRLTLLDRLRGDVDPVAVLATVPGLGPKLAERVHAELGIATLEALETAAHDGRLARLAGFGEKRLTGIRDSLGSRLSRVRSSPRIGTGGPEPPVEELLDVDREYRHGAEMGTIPRIAPRRFNPRRERWLPVLHTSRDGRRYTALFSNTARAHALGRTRDWVVVYADEGSGEQPFTVVSGEHGRRIVRGRERECEAIPATDAERAASEMPPKSDPPPNSPSRTGKTASTGVRIQDPVMTERDPPLSKSPLNVPDASRSLVGTR
jgi:hypothetical protein